jgi:hypothetical protein
MPYQQMSTSMADLYFTARIPAQSAAEILQATEATGVPISHIIGEAWEAVKPRYRAIMAAKAAHAGANATNGAGKI